jgi:hypothetical protein
MAESLLKLECQSQKMNRYFAQLTDDGHRLYRHLTVGL